MRGMMRVLALVVFAAGFGAWGADAGSGDAGSGWRSEVVSASVDGELLIRVWPDGDTSSGPAADGPVAVSGAISHGFRLTERHGAVIVRVLPAVEAALEGLSGGEYYGLRDAHVANMAAGGDSRTAHPLRRLWDAHALEARLAVEKPLADAGSWGGGVRPVAVVPVSFGEGDFAGWPDVDYGLAVYLERTDGGGSDWSVGLDTGTLEGTAAWDQYGGPSWAIKAAPAYPLGGPVTVYTGFWGWGADNGLPIGGPGAVVSADGGVVAEVAGVPKGANRESFGDDVTVYGLPIDAAGRYRLRVPGVGLSAWFDVGPQAYGPMYVASARALWMQRRGAALGAAYTDWTRPAAPSMREIGVSEYVREAFGPAALQVPGSWNARRFVIYGATARDENVVMLAGGTGAGDAGDFDGPNLNHVPAYQHALAALEWFESARGPLGTAATYDSVPDLLAEVLWALEAWGALMDDAGGVPGYVETTSGHAPYEAGVKWYRGLPQREMSLAFAGLCAQTQRLMAAHGWGDAARLDQLGAWARRAYGYGLDASNALDVTLAIGGETYRHKDNANATLAYELWARSEMQRAGLAETTPEQFGALVGALLLDPPADPITGKRQGAYVPGKRGMYPHQVALQYAYMGIALRAVPVSDRVRGAVIEQCFIGPADELVSYADAQAYRIAVRPGDGRLGWGNSVLYHEAAFLIAAHRVTGRTAYRDVAVEQISVMLGASPQGITRPVLPMGRGPLVMQHHLETMHGAAPWGYTVYGQSGSWGLLRTLARERDAGTGQRVWVWDLASPPAWHTYQAHESQGTSENEPSLQETLGPAPLCFAAFLEAAPAASVGIWGMPTAAVYGARLGYLP